MKMFKRLSVFVLFLVVLVGCGKSVNIEDLTEIEVTGYDGYGFLSLDFDYEAATKKLSTGKAKDLEANFKILELMYSVDFAYEEENGKLSNKDKISVVATYDENMAKEAKVKFKGTKFTVKVSGLEEANVVSVKDNIELVESGVSPNIKVSLKYVGNDGLDSYINYEIVDKKADIDKGMWRNSVGQYETGDIVRVKITPNFTGALTDGSVILEEEIDLKVTTSTEYAKDLKLSQLVGLEDLVRTEIEIYANNLTRQNKISFAEDIEEWSRWRNYLSFDYTYEISNLLKGFYIHERDNLSNNLLALVYKVDYEGKLTENRTGDERWAKDSVKNIKPGEKFQKEHYYLIWIEDIALENGSIDFSKTSKKVSIKEHYETLIEATSRAKTYQIVDDAVVIELK